MPPRSVKYTATQSRAYRAQHAAKAAREMVLANLRTPTRRPRASAPDELKWVDQAVAITPGTGVPQLAVGTVVSGNLGIIAQGSTENTRDGRKIQVKSVRMTGLFKFAPAASAAPIAGTCRMWLIQDKQQNGVATVAADIQAASVTTAADFVPLVAAEKRFKFLKSWTFNYGVTGGATTAYAASFSKFIDTTLKCDIPIEYSVGTTGAIATIRSNNLFLMYGCTDEQGAVAGTVTYAGTARLRFYG